MYKINNFIETYLPWKNFRFTHIVYLFQYLTRPDTSDSGVDTGEEGIGGGGGSTSGGESSRAEKV